MRILILTIMTILIKVSYSQDTDIFLTKENNCYSYIDANGDIVIDKKFEKSGRFYEGLAVARKNGYVGYINRKGEFEIEPDYEYCLPFHFGVAKVFKDGKPYLINEKGEILFEHDYRYIDYAIVNSKYPLFIVTQQNDNKRIINSKNEIILGTYFDIFYEIRPFVEGLSVVKKRNRHESDAVVDTSGNFIVPFGTYFNISDFNEGFAYVTLNFDDNTKFGFINKKGALVFSNETNHWRFPKHRNKQISNNSFIVEIPIEQDTTSQNFYNRDSISAREIVVNSVDALVNPYGEIMYSKKGQRIIGYKNGLTCIYDGRLWLLDTLNNISEISTFEFKSLFSEKTDTNTLFIGELKFEKDKHNLGRYINKKGEIIWQEQNTISDNLISKININYAKSAHYTLQLSEILVPTSNDLLSHSNCKIELQLLQDTVVLNFGYKKYLGHTLVLKNFSSDTVFYYKNDDLNFIMQAKDRNGNWRDIEYCISNDMMSDELSYIGPNEFRRYTTLQYDGGFKTKLRVYLHIPEINGPTSSYYNAKINKLIINSPLISKERHIFSNEIDANINASQFVRTSCTMEDGLFPFEDYQFQRPIFIE